VRWLTAVAEIFKFVSRAFAMASIGRLLQIVGLVLPPLSIILELQGAIRSGQMLIALVAAVSAFWIGRILEGYARQ
jgi:F0F1-type ATP synthase membrane subunit a